MVLCQLCSLDHLNVSGFGRPPPRHGLQLLFWFANRCVIFDPNNTADTMLLVLDCQPEKGVYGFHQFGNIEELLPVLSKPKKQKSKKQLAYFVIGNLSTKTYPESADLPLFVRERYGMDRNHIGSNMDRIIISYQVKTRVVEKVYVTEHDYKDFGGFRSDGTHEVSPELIRVLRDPQLDLSTFLSWMGYYKDVETVQEMEDVQDPDVSVQMIFSMMQNDPCRFLSEGLGDLDLTFDPSGCDQQEQYTFSSNGSAGLVAKFAPVKQKNKKSKAKKRQKVLMQTYLEPRWELLYRAFDEEDRRKRSPGGDFSWMRVLLGVGAIYLAAKCFSWLIRSCLKSSDKSYLLRLIPPRTRSFPQAHIMLDYIY